MHRHNPLPSLVEGGGKIEDFDGGSFTITHITPSVSLSLDSSLKEGANYKSASQTLYFALCILHFAFCSTNSILFYILRLQVDTLIAFCYNTYQVIIMAKTNCETCVNYYYDDELEEYCCDINLDEDEMVRFLTSSNYQCPYYRLYDEYGIVKKQN